MTILFLRRFLFIGAAILLSAPSTAAYNPFDTVAETTHRQLTWDDFKGSGKQHGRWSDGYTAHIVTTIRLTRYQAETTEIEEGRWTATAPEIEAYAVMDKMLSGAASVAKEEKVLAHEQLHFDLAETWARRLTHELRTLTGSGATERSATIDLRSQADRARQEAFQALEAMQARYDDETQHGLRKKIQKQWSQTIADWFVEAGTGTVQ